MLPSIKLIEYNLFDNPPIEIDFGFKDDDFNNILTDLCEKELKKKKEKVWFHF